MELHGIWDVLVIIGIWARRQLWFWWFLCIQETSAWSSCSIYSMTMSWLVEIRLKTVFETKICLQMQVMWIKSSLMVVLQTFRAFESLFWASSLARNCLRLRMALYCFAFTYIGSSCGGWSRGRGTLVPTIWECTWTNLNGKYLIGASKGDSRQQPRELVCYI